MKTNYKLRALIDAFTDLAESTGCSERGLMESLLDIFDPEELLELGYGGRVKAYLEEYGAEGEWNAVSRKVEELNMTKNEVSEIIRNKARAHGFETSEEMGHHGFPDILSEELNFTYSNTPTENTDWRAGILEQTLTITASVRRMGGQPTAEELLQTADEVRRGAELLIELQGIDLTWKEQFSVS